MESGSGTREGRCHVWKRAVTVFGIIALSMIGGAIGAGRFAGAITNSGDRAIFEPMSPVRILDTRDGTGTGGTIAKIGPAATIDVQGRGVFGIPTDATAIVINVTVQGGTANSHLRVFPAGAPLPNSSSLNFTAGAELANLVTVQLNTVNGKFRVYNNSGSTHVIADLVGYYRAHAHDDRYYTKAEIDAMDLSDFAAATGNLNVNLTNLSVPAGQCVLVSPFTTINFDPGDMIVPRLVSGTVAHSGVQFLVTTAANSATTTRLVACNHGSTDATLNGAFGFQILAFR